MSLEAEALEEVAVKARKDNESDTEDDVVYEVDSDDEIVWKDYSCTCTYISIIKKNRAFYYNLGPGWLEGLLNH